MRRRLPLVLIVFFIVFFAGCTTQTPPPYNPNYSNPNNHHSSPGGGGGRSEHTNDSEDNSSENPSENSTETMVSLQPKNILSSVGQSFSVTIFCEPARPIKSWELTIAFDPFYLQAIDVAYGTFFEDFMAFPSPNIDIDNIAGRITKLYNLVIGTGNTTAPGTFVIIQFECVCWGHASITINSIGITNETMYIPVLTNNCTINIS